MKKILLSSALLFVFSGVMCRQAQDSLGESSSSAQQQDVANYRDLAEQLSGAISEAGALNRINVLAHLAQQARNYANEVQPLSGGMYHRFSRLAARAERHIHDFNHQESREDKSGRSVRRRFF